METTLSGNLWQALKPGGVALVCFAISTAFTISGQSLDLARYDWLPQVVKDWMFPAGMVLFGLMLLSVVAGVVRTRLRPLTVRADATEIALPAWHGLSTQTFLPEQVTGAKLASDSDNRWIEVVHANGETKLPVYMFDSPETMERFCDALQTYADRPVY